MSLKSTISKKDRLFLEWKDSHIHTSPWFQERCITSQDLYKYTREGLLKSLGGGAYAKASEKLHWRAGVLASQKELKLSFHVGEEMAFHLLSALDYEDSKKVKNLSARLIARKKLCFPSWLKNNKWDCELYFKKSSLFKTDIGLELHKHSKFPILISSKGRAVLEFIEGHSFEESYRFFKKQHIKLLSIAPEWMKALLSQCSCLKVKKTFFRLASSLNLPIAKQMSKKKSA